MKKKMILFLTLAIFSTQLFAQDDQEDKPFKFGLGATMAVPLGDFKESASYGVGFEHWVFTALVLA